MPLINLFIIGIFFPLYACTQPGLNGSRSVAMGGCMLGLQDNWSAEGNQAGLAAIHKKSIAFAFENKFLLHDLSGIACVGVYPLPASVIALSVCQIGNSLYAQSKAAFSSAKKFGSHFQAGMQLACHSVRIENYGSAFTYTVSGGFTVDFNSKLLIAFHFFNPFHAGFDHTSINDLPAGLRLGFSKSISGKVLIMSELKEDVQHPPEWMSGLEYEFQKGVFVRSGFNFQQSTFHAGFGYVNRTFHFDIASFFHPLLGSSNELSIQYDY